MSIAIDINKFTKENLVQIENDLEIKSVDNFNNSVKTIYPYCREGELVYLPFQYALSRFPELAKRPERASFPKQDIKFEGTLRELQKEVKKDVITTLNKQGSIMICMGCGIGKCLGKDTPILMYSGQRKKVQDIQVGEQIMGDDSKPRNILSVCTGSERLYKISPLYVAGDIKQFTPYIVNESHILSLGKLALTSKGARFTKIDIPLLEYLSFDPHKRKDYYGYKHIPEFQEQKIEVDPYIYGNITKITKHIEDCYLYNTSAIREKVLLGLISFQRYTQIVSIKTESLNYINQILFLVDSLAFDHSDIIKDEDGVYSFDFFYNESPLNFYSIEVQELGIGDYYGFTIDGNRRFLLGDCTVTHNTIFSIYVSSLISMKTMIITNVLILFKQWEKSIYDVCPQTKVQIVESKDTLDPSATFYIMNPENIPKRNRDIYKDIGLVICDESHLLTTTMNIKSLQYFTPRYLIGLTATPTRPDGFDVLLDLYFGKDRIYKDKKTEHLVYKVTTQFEPEIVYNAMGKVNWNIVLQSLAENKERNEMIINIINLLSPDRNILVLSKRKSQIEYLCNRLKELGHSVFNLSGKARNVDDSRIIVATIKKAGVGMDLPRLNTLILAGDCQEFYIQYLKRIMRKDDIKPIIFDIVDKNTILKKHFAERKKVYLENGGIIKEYKFN